jgi:hypothetical protein
MAAAALGLFLLPSNRSSCLSVVLLHSTHKQGSSHLVNPTCSVAPSYSLRLWFCQVSSTASCGTTCSSCSTGRGLSLGQRCCQVQSEDIQQCNQTVEIGAYVPGSYQVSRLPWLHALNSRPWFICVPGALLMCSYVFFRKKTFRFEVLKRVLQVCVLGGGRGGTETGTVCAYWYVWLGHSQGHFRVYPLEMTNIDDPPFLMLQGSSVSGWVGIGVGVWWGPGVLCGWEGAGSCRVSRNVKKKASK